MAENINSISGFFFCGGVNLLAEAAGRAAGVTVGELTVGVLALDEALLAGTRGAGVVCTDWAGREAEVTGAVDR